MNTQKTCKERIKDFKKVNKAEEPIEELNDIALALTRTELYKLELSWGGAQDYFIFEYDSKNKELVNIEYHFLDWFDGAVRRILYNTEEWKILEEIFYNCILIE